MDPADHEREFMVAVRVVDAGGYELMDCDPDMGDAAQRLLAECNRTDNLSGFVRGVRKLFRASRRGGGGGGGGGAQGEGEGLGAELRAGG